MEEILFVLPSLFSKVGEAGGALCRRTILSREALKQEELRRSTSLVRLLLIVVAVPLRSL